MNYKRLLIILFTLFLITGCLPEIEEPHMDEMPHDTHIDTDDTTNKVPNNGAVIRILSPDDGATFAASDEILIEIETENFTLNENGNHWHIFIDGKSWGMVIGDNKDQILRNLKLEPGTHQIEVVLSIGTHEEMEDGDSITITIGK